MKDPEQTQRILTSMLEILSSHTLQIKELRTTIDSLVDDNKSLSAKVTIVYKELIEAKAESRKLSEKVERQASENERLTGLLKIQSEDSAAMRNNLTSTQKEISKEANSRSNDSIKDANGYTLISSRAEHKVSKRIVLHSDSDILHLVTAQGTEIQKLQTDVAALKNGSQTHSTDLNKLEADVTALKTNKPKGESGSTYVRWGRTNCSGNGTERIYSGYAAGSDYMDSGAAANYLCLSPDPLWGNYTDAHDAGAKVMGVEYELYGTVPGDTTAFFHKRLHNEDAPCSVCRSPRPTVIMIPGRNQCYSGWTLEYKGYLVAGRSTHVASTEYVCLDESPEVIPGGHASVNGALFYMVEGRCDRALTCPPYEDGRELTCVVCSK